MGFKQKWKNPAGTRTYYAWRSMHVRCRDLNNPHYGGRGISVCPEWASYDTFYDDMGECPDRHSLDRIDNNAGYSPSNCRWVTIREQLNNQRRNRRITHMGKAQTLSQWAEELGIRLDTLSKRLSRMPVESALRSGIIRPSWQHGTRSGYERKFLGKEATEGCFVCERRAGRSRLLYSGHVVEPHACWRVCVSRT